MASANTGTFQALIANEGDNINAQKRRTLYLRPFLLFWINSFIFEAVMLSVGVFVFSGLRDIFPKFMWTIIFCPLGMGGAMGGLINAFCVDRIYGSRAVQFCAVLSVLVLGSCNMLCYNLDLVFGWFGAEDHFWWWHWRYLLIYFVGYTNGKLLFTDHGQDMMARWGV